MSEQQIAFLIAQWGWEPQQSGPYWVWCLGAETCDAGLAFGPQYLPRYVFEALGDGVPVGEGARGYATLTDAFADLVRVLRDLPSDDPRSANSPAKGEA